MHVGDGDFRICGRWANNLGLRLTDQQLHTPSHAPGAGPLPLSSVLGPGSDALHSRPAPRTHGTGRSGQPRPGPRLGESEASCSRGGGQAWGAWGAAGVLLGAVTT